MEEDKKPTVEKVEEVLEASFKTGIGKNGQKWNLASVLTDKGKKVRIFGYPKVGDEVELTYSDEYKSWGGSVKRVTMDELAAALKRIEEKLDKLIGE